MDAATLFVAPDPLAESPAALRAGRVASPTSLVPRVGGWRTGFALAARPEPASWGGFGVRDRLGAAAGGGLRDSGAGPVSGRPAPDSPGDCHPGGGTTSTMLLHFGQVRICPMAASSRTLSLAWQVAQVMVKRVRSTTLASQLKETPGATRPRTATLSILERRHGDVSRIADTAAPTPTAMPLETDAPLRGSTCQRSRIARGPTGGRRVQPVRVGPMSPNRRGCLACCA